MITGDHPQTAMSIGQMLGITNSSRAMTGYQLEHMDDAALAKAAVEYDIFARTSPEHKLRPVKALQDNGEVVGMTGDGVNDAPALRRRRGYRHGYQRHRSHQRGGRHGVDR